MSMECNCVCAVDDYDAPEFITQKFVTARKDHKCCECNRMIRPGERYESSSGKWPMETGINTFRTCLGCMRLRRDLCRDGFLYGGLCEVVWDCLGVCIVTGEVDDDDDDNAL